MKCLPDFTFYIFFAFALLSFSKDQKTKRIKNILEKKTKNENKNFNFRQSVGI
jgi:hypothetical protein